LRFARLLPGRTFIAGLLCGVVLVFAAAAFINETDLADWIIAPLLIDDVTERSQAIVVLGAGVLEGCIPSDNSLRRVLLGTRLYREGRAPMIVFTGGTGDDCPVARAMSAFARQFGVPADAIREETVSRNTWENGSFAAPLLRAWGIERVLLVTDRLHMRRAAGVFAGLGFDVRPVNVPIGEGHEDNVGMLRAGLREFMALAYYRVRGRMGPSDATDAAAIATHNRGPMVNASGPVIVLGASYALGWTLDSVAGVQVINRGVAGQQSFQLLERFDEDVVKANPRAVVLWGFINDIFRAPADIEPTLATVRRSYTEMIARAKRQGIRPILATEVTIRPRSTSFYERVTNTVGTILRRESYQDRINAHVLAINKWLIDTAAQEGLPVLQFQAVLAESGGRRRARFAQPDGSHITEAGYAVLTSYAVPVLEQLLSDK